jgi:hypothetical protein
MSKITKSMFESIKKKLTENVSGSNFKDFLKLEPGHTYVVRLLPNIKDPEKSFFHYYSHGWQSLATGKYIGAMSPTTFGDRDPISEASLAIRKKGTDEEKEKAKALNRKENWLVNVFVVSDPKTPENNGKIKIVRYGRQLHKIIMDAIEGDDAAEFGDKIFDLSSNGCSLKIKVEKNQGGYPTYVSSRFASPSDIGLTEPQQEAIYKGVFDLSTIQPVLSYEQLKEMLDTHYYCKDPKGGKTTSNVVETKPTGIATPNIVPDVAPEPEGAENIDDTIDDDEVKELLKGL